jgi:hypothetical protein
VAGAGDRHGWGGDQPVDEAALSPLRPCELVHEHGSRYGPTADMEEGRHALASSVRQQLTQAATTTNSTASHRGWCRRAPTPTHLTPSRYAALVISSSCCCTLPVRLSATVTPKFFPLYHSPPHFLPYFFISRSGSH